MGDKIKALWRKTSWAWSPESERESSESIVKNFWLHWFPAKVARASMDWNYSFWLGTASASLLLILTVTGVMLMFFYVPSTERAYGSIKDLEYAVSFGRLLRNQHRWAAEGMVAVVYIHMARVFFTGAYRGPARSTGWSGSSSSCDFAAVLHRLPAAVGSARILGDHRRHQHRASRRRWSDRRSNSSCLAAMKSGSRRLLRFYVLHVFFLPVFVLVLFAYHMWRVRKDGGLAAIERVRHERAMAPKATAQDQKLLAVRDYAGNFRAGDEFHRPRRVRPGFLVAEYVAPNRAGLPDRVQRHAAGRVDVQCAAGGSRQSIGDAESGQSAVVFRLAAGVGRFNDRSPGRVYRQRRACSAEYCCRDFCSPCLRYGRGSIVRHFAPKGDGSHPSASGRT